MARQLRLFLIRHGETVDNVAQVYAGSRDSALTNHGYQQATRLGRHFKAMGLSFTHIFSSHLQRAATTAGLIREAQVTHPVSPESWSEVPDVVQLPLIMEQDFGFYEGKKWHEPPPKSKVVGEDATGFVDVESRDSMAQRVDTFIDAHLLPLLDSPTESTGHVVAVVSHGIILSVLWKRLLLRLPPSSVAFSPELSANGRSSLEHLGGWSNTGYLELHMERIVVQEPALLPSSEPSLPLDDSGTTKTNVGHWDVSQVNPSDTVISEQGPSGANVQPAASATQPSSKLTHGWTTTIQTINGKDHLKTLKRTGGGVGSARHDSSQKNIDGFFKRRKIDQS